MSGICTWKCHCDFISDNYDVRTDAHVMPSFNISIGIESQKGKAEVLTVNGQG